MLYSFMFIVFLILWILVLAPSLLTVEFSFNVVLSLIICLEMCFMALIVLFIGKGVFGGDLLFLVLLIGEIYVIILFSSLEGADFNSFLGGGNN